MASDPRSRITDVVSRLGEVGGSAAASADDWMPLVYDELRRLAGSRMARERPGHTLQPTALVHEVYLKLVDQTRVQWRGRTHFFAIGANMMRRVLVDHARSVRREKRGGGVQRVTLCETLAPADDTAMDLEQLLALNRSLEQLAVADERQARIVELRFFGGLTVAEIAEVLQVSKRTVEGDWTHARAWLRRRLATEDVD